MKKYLCIVNQINCYKTILNNLTLRLEKTFLKSVSFERITNELFINRSNDTKSSRSYHGLASILIQNMIQGVEKKFFKILVAEGVGYKFQVDNQLLQQLEF